jgi:NADPH:quinone reductase-like Zn-dependent oxidoreductase
VEGDQQELHRRKISRRTVDGLGEGGSQACLAIEQDVALVREVPEDYRAFNANTYRGRFDVVFDTHGGLSLGQCDAMLKPGGLALHIVPTHIKMIRSMFSSRHQTVFAQLTPQSMAGIVEAVDQGKLVAAIGRTVPLSEAIPAVIELEKSSLPQGKLMIIPM